MGSVALHAAVATSEHPLATQAAGECLGALLESGGRPASPPDLVLVGVTPPLGGGALEDVLGAVDALVGPASTLGVVGRGLLLGQREVGSSPGLFLLGLWAGRGGALEAVRLGPGPVGAGPLEGRRGTAVVLGDPFSVAPRELLADLGSRAPALRVVGGLLSAATRPGGNTLVLDGRVHRDGAVAVWFAPELPVELAASPPEGPPAHGAQPHAGGSALVLVSDERDGSVFGVEEAGAARVGISCGVQFGRCPALDGVHERAVAAVLLGHA